MSLQPLGVNTGSIAHRPLGKRFLREQWRLGHFAKPLGYRTPVAQALPPLGQHSPLLLPETGFSGWEMEGFWQSDRPPLRDTASRSSAEERQLPAAPEQRPASRLQRQPEAKFPDNAGTPIPSTPDVSRHAANQPSPTLLASVTPQSQRENVSALSHVSLKPLGHHVPLVQPRSLLASISHSDPEATALGKSRSRMAPGSQTYPVTEKVEPFTNPEALDRQSTATDSLQLKEESTEIKNHSLEKPFEHKNHQSIQRETLQLKPNLTSETNHHSSPSSGEALPSSTPESPSLSPSSLIQPRLESLPDAPAYNQQASAISPAESHHAPLGSPSTPISPAPSLSPAPHQTAELSPASDAAAHPSIIQRKDTSSAPLAASIEEQPQSTIAAPAPHRRGGVEPTLTHHSDSNSSPPSPSPISHSSDDRLQTQRRSQKSVLQRSSISDIPEATLAIPSIQPKQQLQQSVAFDRSETTNPISLSPRPQTGDTDTIQAAINASSPELHSVSSARSSINEHYLTSYRADSTAPESPTTPAKTTIQAKSIPSGDQQNLSIPEIASPAALNPLGRSKPLSPTLNQALNQSLFFKPINVHTAPTAETDDQGVEFNGHKPSIENSSSVKAIPDSWSSLTELIGGQSSSAIANDRPSTESAAHSLINRYLQPEESHSIALQEGSAHPTSSERSTSLKSPISKTDRQVTPADERSFELLAQQVYRSVRQRMGIEQEYQQNYSVCYPEWFNFVLLNSLSNTVSSNKPSHSTGSSSTPKQPNDQSDGAIISRKLQQLVDAVYILLHWRSSIERERCVYGYLNSRYSIN